MKFSIEYDLEDDGRWIAEIPSIPGVLAYGNTKEDAATKVITLAIDVLSANDNVEIYPTMLELEYETA
ncbi:MAG: DUF1902 domain-containing protein [Candidatus Kapabacteria bacterium]|nr:DUF1902 domain-containing protein [Ignavibacteriota bacterium]MCW5885902.1 DUF1902 domain-containing protein [Candidatus Kapabacteria bacterium]